MGFVVNNELLPLMKRNFAESKGFDGSQPVYIFDFSTELSGGENMREKFVVTGFEPAENKDGAVEAESRFDQIVDLNIYRIYDRIDCRLASAKTVRLLGQMPVTAVTQRKGLPAINLLNPESVGFDAFRINK